MTSCAWPQSARGRTRALRGRPTPRPISICGDSSMAKPTNIGTKVKSTPLLRVADAAPAALQQAALQQAALRLEAAGSNPETGNTSADNNGERARAVIPSANVRPFVAPPPRGAPARAAAQAFARR